MEGDIESILGASRPWPEVLQNHWPGNWDTHSFMFFLASAGWVNLVKSSAYFLP